MEYRQLGSSDLKVSEIALGSWLTYGVAVEQSRSRACVHRAFDEGINFIDTANIYGKGAAESALGIILADFPRDSYILATKLYFPMTGTDAGLSHDQIHKQINASLTRLNTDYVDLYQCHRYDEDTPLEETMTALTEVVEAGKARYIGFSEWRPEQIQSAIEMVDVACFVSSQPQYSALQRVPELGVIDLCCENGISQIVFCPLAQGVLTGKYKPGTAPPLDSRAANDEMNIFMGRFQDDASLERIGQLGPIAESVGLSMSQLALAWVLHEPNVAAAITGATRPEQVSENAAASGHTLADEVLEQIDQVLEPLIQRRPDSA